MIEIETVLLNIKVAKNDCFGVRHVDSCEDKYELNLNNYKITNYCNKKDLVELKYAIEDIVAYIERIEERDNE